MAVLPTPALPAKMIICLVSSSNKESTISFLSNLITLPAKFISECIGNNIASVCLCNSLRKSIILFPDSKKCSLMYLFSGRSNCLSI